jgi:GntR family transcriptional regulator
MAGDERPKYRQIADDLRARMESGEFPPDSQLPSKAGMMSHYGVALATVNNAIGVLRGEGRAETVQGLGTFARKPPAGPSSEYEAVMARMDALAEEVRQLRAEVAALKQQ